MVWLETSIGYAPSTVAVELAADERLACAALVLERCPEVLPEIVARAHPRAARTAQRVRPDGLDQRRFARERAANPHTDPDQLAALCTHPGASTRLAAWTNPSTPDAAVLAALANAARDPVFLLRSAEAHVALATRAGAVVVAHPSTAAALAGHWHGAVRSGAVKFGTVDPDVVTALPNSTRQTFGLLTNPSVPTDDPTPERRALDAILDGRSCAEAVAAMDEDAARRAARVGAPLLDLALARRFPRILLEETCGSLRSESYYLSPVVLAVACEADPQSWLLALSGHSGARIRLARPYSPVLDVATTLAWPSLHRTTAVAHSASLHRARAEAAARLGDDPSAWRLWGTLTANVALDDPDTALQLVDAARGAVH